MQGCCKQIEGKVLVKLTISVGQKITATIAAWGHDMGTQELILTATLTGNMV